MILRCSCTDGVGAKQQDELYGHSQRVHNLCKEGKAARCIVCGNEKPVSNQSGSEPKEKKKK